MQSAFLKLLTPALLLGAAAAQVQAQSPVWPTRPVTFVIAFGPGASTDTETRIYTQKLTENVGRPFVIDYKPGAGTVIGNTFVAKSAPDGYTFQGITGSFSTSAALHPKLPYDPIKDFDAISLMSRRTTLVVTHPNAPFKTFKEYVAYGKANPGKVNVATTGSGGSPHLNSVWLNDLLDIKATYVHYKGSAPANNDLVAGRVDLYLTTGLGAIPLLKANKIRALALANPERSPLFPDLTPASDMGAPGFDYASIYGIIAPAGVPRPIVNRLVTELQKVAKDPEVIKRIQGDGGTMVASSPEVFRKTMVEEIARYKKIAAENNIKLEE
jgi:tripartite-type tricarboxylate transporter receptor subunit TctC